MVKDRLQPHKKAFLVFSFEQLDITSVALWKGYVQSLPLMPNTVFIEICFSKVHLRLTGLVK